MDLDDTTWRACERIMYALAYQRWKIDGSRNDLSDYWSVGYEALATALRRFDEARARASLLTWVHETIRSRLGDVARYEHGHNPRRKGRQRLHLFATPPPVPLHDRLEQATACRRWVASLTASEQRTLAAIAMGGQARTIAKRLGHTEKTVWLHAHCLRKKYREARLHE